MGNLEKMVGSPWHVEKMTRSEGDDRRHRSRCIHYSGKQEGHCDYFCVKCRGAAHCEKYAENQIQNNELSQDNNTNLAKKTASCIKFAGIKYIPMNLIVPDNKFRDKIPKEKKIREVKEYIRINGQLDKPVAVTCNGSFYKLQDKYLRYYVAEELGLKEIPAETGNAEELANYDKLRTLGTIVWVKKYGEVAEVIGFSLSQTTLRLDSGKEKIFDIHRSLETKTIRIL